MKFFLEADLVQWVNEGVRSGDDYKRRSILKHVGVLIIDDFGTRERVTAPRYELLFEIIDARIGWGGPTILTSNYSLEELAKRFANDSEGHVDAQRGEKLVGRIVEACDIVKVEGPNRRVA